MAKNSKKNRKKIRKEDRKNLRLWAEGVREEVLTCHIEPYADAIERSWRAERDYLQTICNEFNALISWRLADHKEPDLPLPEYDSNKIVTPELLTEDEEAEQRAKFALLETVSDAERSDAYHLTVTCILV
jgi:hypothetical protein